MRGFGVLAIVMLLTLGSSAEGGLLPTKGSQLVTVFGANSCPINGFTGSSSLLFSQMVNADGTTTPFAIPPKRIFVITDVTISGSAEPAGDAILALVPVGTAAVGSPIAGRFDVVTSAGTFAIAFEFPAGVPVRSGSVVCSQILNLTHGGFVGSVALAHGFFAADK